MNRRLIAILAVAVAVAVAVWLGWRTLRHPTDTAAPGTADTAAEIAAGSRPGRPVLFVGLDGADWQLLDRYLERGLMPNLATLVAEGRSGVLHSERPLLSPLLWTTMLTGVSPLEHRILDFTRFHPESGRQEPITSTERRVPAIWNMVTAGGRSVASFGMWATYPAEEVTGVMVSERLFSFFHLADELPERTVHPPDREAWARQHLAAAEKEVDIERMRRFLPLLTAEEYRLHARSAQPYDHPISALRRILVETLVYHRLAMDALERDSPDLALLYIQGTDTIGHTFASFAPPRQPSVPEPEYQRYHRVPELFFAWVDELVGQYLEHIRQRRGALLLASDHGFEWGESRPTASSFDRDTAVFWHRSEGVYLMWGEGLPGEAATRHEGDLRQVAATLLELLGLPPGRGVAGPPLPPLPEPATPAVAYRPLYRPTAETRPPDDADVEREIAKLRALGYLGGGSDETAAGPRAGAVDPTRTAGSYNNEGVLLKADGRLEEAEEAFREAVATDPGRPAGHANLGLLTSDQGRHDEAIRHFRSALRLSPAAADSYLNLATALVRADRFEEATEAYRRCATNLERLRQGGPLSPGEAECRRLLAATESGALSREAVARHLPSPAEVERELGGLCEAVRNGPNPFYGIARVDALRRRLERSLGDREAVAVQMELARELLRIGRPGEAAQLGGAAVQRAAAAGMEIPVQLQALTDLGLAYLRIADVQSCVNRDLTGLCALPSAGTRPEPAAAVEALRAFKAVLSGAPDLVSVRWLANLAAMASGGFPGEIAAGDRVAEDRLRSRSSFPTFRETARAVGLGMTGGGGGVAIDDFDNDGWLDVVATAVDPCTPLRYFRNDRRGGFEERAAAAGLSGQLGGIELLPADYDNDGRLDLFVVRGAGLGEEGRVRNSLLRNNGDGTFADVTFAAGVAWPADASRTAAWSDIDGDGRLDLYVANQAVTDGSQPAARLFRNNGDGTFTDVAEAAGVSNQRSAAGAAFADFDADGDPDLFVANLGADRLYRNNGDGTFTDVADSLGVAGPADASSTTWWFDYDNDGDPDLFVASAEAGLDEVAAHYLGGDVAIGRPRLYRNEGGQRFVEVGGELGLTAPAPAAGGGFADLDNDGWLDFLLGTGIGGFEALMPNLAYRGEEGRSFTDVTSAGGFGQLHKGAAVAFADIDNDGDRDVFQRMGGRLPGDIYPSLLFENPAGGDGAWLSLRLVGTASNRSAVGARVVLTLGGDRSIHRTVGGGGTGGASPLRLHVGLGSLESGVVPRIEILWPAGGAAQRFDNVPAGRFYEVREGSDELVELPLRPAPLRRGS